HSAAGEAGPSSAGGAGGGRGRGARSRRGTARRTARVAGRQKCRRERPMAPRAVAQLASPGGQGRLVGLLPAPGDDRRGAVRGPRVDRGTSVRGRGRLAEEVGGPPLS